MRCIAEVGDKIWIYLLYGTIKFTEVDLLAGKCNAHTSSFANNIIPSCYITYEALFGALEGWEKFY